MLQELPQNIVSPQKGAAPHYTKGVSDLLDAKVKNSWIGRVRPKNYPPGFQDFIPYDFLC